MILPVFSAPLQGFTDAAYRRAHAASAGGVEAYFTPFLRVEHGQIRARDLRDITRQEEDPLTVPQVIASDPAELRTLCSAVKASGYQWTDINLGCPFPMQTRLGRGAGMLEQPDAFRALMEELRLINEEDGMRFSLKMRLGNSAPDEWKSLISSLNAAPLEMVTMHPRIGRQQYKGSVDMEAFGEFCAACAHPVVYNGDLSSVSDIEAVAMRFPDLAGVMLGRGLLSRPTLAREYRSGCEAPETEVRRSVLAIHDSVLADYERRLEGGDGQVLQKIQPFWEYAGACFDRKTVKKLLKTESLDAYRRLLSKL